MIFRASPLAGVCTIDLQKREDDRGFFARMFCTREFAAHGLQTDFVQINNSLSTARGTLRGMHYQLAPAAETKVVRCVRGALFDVVLDLRADSPTFGQHFGAELSADNRRMMYVPPGCAHGFLTLRPETEAIYLVSAAYDPERERGLRWDDPRFAIRWPEPPAVISDKDRSHPDFDPHYHLG